MHTPISYIRLALAIAGGIVGATLMLWAVAAIFSVAMVNAWLSGLEFTFNEPPASSVQSSPAFAQAQNQTQGAGALASNEASRRADREQRRRHSDRGRELRQRCREWSENHERTPTRTTEVMGDYHCSRYDTYIETGRVAASNPPALGTRSLR